MFICNFSCARDLEKSKKSGDGNRRGSILFAAAGMARILLFGFMDLLIVTAFAVSVAFTVRVSAQMFAVNFMIPFNVTGAICFRFLYCKRSESEYLAAAGCFLFMILWVFIISREEIYCKISGAVWCAALILSIMYLIYVVKRSQSFYGKIYEV